MLVVVWVNARSGRAPRHHERHEVSVRLHRDSRTKSGVPTELHHEHQTRKTKTVRQSSEKLSEIQTFREIRAAGIPDGSVRRSAGLEDRGGSQTGIFKATKTITEQKASTVKHGGGGLV